MNVQGFFYDLEGIDASGYPLTLLLVILLLILLKKYRPVTKKVLAAMNIFKATCCSVTFVVFIIDLANAWYSVNPYKQGAFKWRIMGPYWWSYWIMLVSGFVLPQFFWFKRLRTNLVISFFCIFSGRVFEYIMIVVTQFYRDYRPGSWGVYTPPDFFELSLNFGLYAFCISVVYYLLFNVKRRQARTTMN